MGEEEHVGGGVGGVGWHDNVQQAEDVVAMVTNKDVCIRGKSQQSTEEGTHSTPLTVTKNSQGQR